MNQEIKPLNIYMNILLISRCYWYPSRISTPTIGVLNGLNLGLALDMSSAYSIRIAVKDAVFSIAEVNIGIAADIGSLQDCHLLSITNHY